MIDLQKYRKENKLDQRHIAELTGLDQAIISKYENKKYVTQYVTDTLLEHIPALESYMTDESNMASEPKSEYITGHGSGDKMIDSIFEIIQSNQKLIDNNSKLIEINAELSHFLITKIKNSEKELNHAS